MEKHEKDTKSKLINIPVISHTLPLNFGSSKEKIPILVILANLSHLSIFPHIFSVESFRGKIVSAQQNFVNYWITDFFGAVVAAHKL